MKGDSQKWGTDSGRGRTPGWVLEQTGLKNKAQIVEKYGPKKHFVQK